MIEEKQNKTENKQNKEFRNTEEKWGRMWNFSGERRGQETRVGSIPFLCLPEPLKVTGKLQLEMRSLMNTQLGPLRMYRNTARAPNPTTENKW